MEKIKLELSKGRTINDLQQDFTGRYTFLKLEFYKPVQAGAPIKARERLSPTALLRSAGLKNDGYVEISDDMTVRDLEKKFKDQFGLNIQVSRNSGGIWLETTMTDNWSLQKQNDYGREIISSARKNAN